ncbi:MAG TPA: hypothetical protein VIV61_15925 [Candidatus Ozemobacteraceae bacterium]
MAIQNNISGNSTPSQEPGGESNVISSIIVKTLITIAIGGVAWYLLQHMV